MTIGKAKLANLKNIVSVHQKKFQIIFESSQKSDLMSRILTATSA